MASHERHADDAGHDAMAGVDATLSDDALLDPPDALVEKRGRVVAAGWGSGMNVPPAVGLPRCPRVRNAPVEFGDANGVCGDCPDRLGRNFIDLGAVPAATAENLPPATPAGRSGIPPGNQSSGHPTGAGFDVIPVYRSWRHL